MDDEEVALVRQKLIAVRQAWFNRNEEEVMKRWAFEEAVSLQYSTHTHTSILQPSGLCPGLAR